MKHADHRPRSERVQAGLWPALVAIAITVLIVALIALFAIERARAAPARRPPEVACPAWWKCNGSPKTNAANCKCWEQY